MINEELINKIQDMSNKIDYLVNREKEKENIQKKKNDPERILPKEVDEVFGFYGLYIKPDARISPQSRDAIRDFLKRFGKEVLIATLEKKSKSKWFMENCAWRGASWFFSNKTRFNRWIEEGIPIQKKRPYFMGNIMTYDLKKVLVDGEWKQFVGEPSKIEYK